MSCECALNFDKWKTFSESYKPMRVWLWLVYKFTKNFCRFHFSQSSLNLKRGIPPLLKKCISYNLKSSCHIKLKFLLWTKVLENLLLAKYLISVAAALITPYSLMVVLFDSQITLVNWILNWIPETCTEPF